MGIRTFRYHRLVHQSSGFKSSGQARSLLQKFTQSRINSNGTVTNSLCLRERKEAILSLNARDVDTLGALSLAHLNFSQLLKRQRMASYVKMKFSFELLHISRIVKHVRSFHNQVFSDSKDRATETTQTILALSILIQRASLLATLFLRSLVICLPSHRKSLIRSKFSQIRNSISTSCAEHACSVAVFGSSSRREPKEDRNIITEQHENGVPWVKKRFQTESKSQSLTYILDERLKHDIF